MGAELAGSGDMKMAYIQARASAFTDAGALHDRWQGFAGVLQGLSQANRGGGSGLAGLSGTEWATLEPGRIARARLFGWRDKELRVTVRLVRK